MKRLLLACAVGTMTLSLSARDGNAGTHAHGQAQAHHARPVHVGHSGPYCIYYRGKQGHASPYRYVYKTRRYPRYYGSTHVRALQNVGIPTGDIGIRDTAW